MSFPNTIQPTPQGYDMGSLNTAGNGNFGFNFGSNEYFFGYQNGTGSSLGDQKVHALKSTDGGNTWTEQDSTHAPSLPSITLFNPCFTVGFDNAASKALVLSVHAVTSGGVPVIDGLRLSVYNLATDTWVAPVSFTSPLPDWNGEPGNDQTGIDLLVCGANDYIMVYAGPRETVAGTAYGRVYTATFNGTSFGTPIILPGQSGNATLYCSTGACFDNTNNVEHYTYLDNTQLQVGVTLGANLLHVARTHGGSFSTSAVVTNNIYQSGNNTGGVSDPIMYTGSALSIGFAAECNDNLAASSQSVRWFTATASLTPTWSNSIASSDQANLPTVLSSSTKGVTAAVGNVRVIGCLLDNNTLDHPNLGNELTEFFYSASTNNIQIIWVVSNGSPNHPAGTFFSVSAPANTLVWGSDALLWNPGLADYYAQQAYAYGPTPSSVLPPTCSLSAVPTSGSPGTLITLTWTTTNTPTSASINNGVGTVNPNGGSTTVSLPAGSTTYVLTVMNSAGTSTCQVTVVGAVISAGCGFVIAARVGVPFTKAFTATGGTAPYTFAITAGNLPFGITLTPSTGVVSGTPTQSGLFFFTVSATDSNGLVASVNCSIPVACP